MTFRELLRQALAEDAEPDPRVVARRVLMMATAEQLAEAQLVGAEYSARQLTHQAAGTWADRHETRVGPSRYLIALRERVNIDGTWKALDDCIHADLLWLAQDYRERSEALIEKAREVETLASDLGRSGCATVGEMRARSSHKVAA